MTTLFLALALILSGAVAYGLCVLGSINRINHREDWE